MTWASGYTLALECDTCTHKEDIADESRRWCWDQARKGGWKIKQDGTGRCVCGQCVLEGREHATARDYHAQRRRYEAALERKAANPSPSNPNAVRALPLDKERLLDVGVPLPDADPPPTSPRPRKRAKGRGEATRPDPSLAHALDALLNS